MDKNILRIVIGFVLSMVGVTVHAQDMEDAKWWMGLKAGANFTRVAVSESFSVFENYSPPNQDQSKQYNSIFKNAGPSIGFSIAHSITPSLAISVQPTYLSYHWGYTTQYLWKDTVNTSYTLTNNLETKLHTYSRDVWQGRQSKT